MKKVLLKTAMSFLVIVFLIQPILQVKLNIGSVEASVSKKIITGYSADGLKAQLEKGESYEIIATQKKYQLTYEGATALSRVLECSINNKFSTGCTMNIRELAGINKAGLYARVSTQGYGYRFQGTTNHIVNIYEKHLGEEYGEVRFTTTFECKTSDFVNEGEYRDSYTAYASYKKKDENTGAVTTETVEVKLNLKNALPVATKYIAVVHKANSKPSSNEIQQLLNNDSYVKEIMQAKETHVTSQNVSYQDYSNYDEYEDYNDYSDYYDYADEQDYEEYEEEIPPIYYDYEEPAEGFNMNEGQKRLYIQHLYNTIIGKDPNNDEVNYWINDSVYDLTLNLFYCPESVARNDVNTFSNEEFARISYRCVLGREASNDEVESMVYFLDRALGRGDVLRKIIKSEEFKSKMLRNTKTITLDSKMSGIIYNKMRAKGYKVAKINNSSFVMYEDDVNKVTDIDLYEDTGLDLNGLSAFKNLNRFTAQDKELYNINELTKFSNLKYLNLDFVKIKDFSPIWGLTNLEELHLQNTNLTNDILNGNINKLSKLQKLYISNNKLVSLKGIDGLANLKVLYVDNNQITDFGNIDNLNLNEFSIKRNYIGNTGSKSEIDLPDMLKRAKQSGNKIYTSDNFECVNCKVENGKIKLNDGQRTAIVRIKGGNADASQYTYTNEAAELKVNDRVLAYRLKNIPELGISEITEKDGKYILYIDRKIMESVQSLDLSATENDREKITDVSGLSNFKNLKSLNLNNNSVTDLYNVSRITKLETLSIRYNGLRNLEGLKSCDKLIQLDASNNYLTDVKDISKLKNLKTLLLSDNNLGNNVKSLSTISSLSTLAISNNNVSDISSLKSLHLKELYASYNNIGSISGFEGVEKLEMKNNTINIDVNGDKADVPAIVTYAMKNGNGFELVNCNILSGKVVLNNSKVAQIKIPKGNLSDTVINFKNVSEVNPPRVTDVKYELSNDKTQMRVTITTDKEIQNVLGWERAGGRNVIYKNFRYNVSNMNIVLKDYYGNETSQIIEFSSIVNPKIPGLSVNYSTTMPTNRDVEVTISSTERFAGIADSSWTLSPDGKSYTKKYTANTQSNYNVAVFSGEGKYEDVLIEVSNIDKQNPICTVEYSTTEPTKGAVRATIWSDEEIDAQNARQELTSKTTKVDENGKTWYGIEVFILGNSTTQFTVVDSAANIEIVDVVVDNIDNGVDGLRTRNSGSLVTNQDETLIVIARESVKLYSDNKSITTAFNNLKLFAKNAEKYKDGEAIYKVAGNLDVVPVMDGYVDRVDLEPKLFISANPLRIAEANNNDEYSSEFEYDIVESGYGHIEAEDRAGNTDLSLVNANNIDTEGPIITREDVVNEDGSVLVTLSSNEELKMDSGIAGWTLSEDLKTLTKVFTANSYETINITDLAGNIIDYEVEVKDVQTVKYNLYFDEIDGTEDVIAIVVAEKELQSLDGWTLFEDKKGMFRIMNKNEISTIVIRDYDGNSSQIRIQFKSNEAENNNQEDNTQYPEVLPQTGNYFIFTGTLIIILTALTIITLKKYLKNS